MAYLLPDSGQRTRSALDQVANNAGGFVYAVDDWTRLDRFLILGTQGGTFYVAEKKFTADNASVVTRLLDVNPQRVIDRIVEISVTGRAPKVDTTLYALALAASHSNIDARTAAFVALPKVARTASHLYQFISYADSMRGWGMGFRKALLRWMAAKSPESLAYQVVKYQSRSDWSFRDILRKAKPSLSVVTDEDRLYDDLFHWVVRGWEDTPDAHELIAKHESDDLKVISAYERAKVAGKPDLSLAAMLPHEAIPNEWKQNADVWSAMLPTMGLTAVIRNLANMTRYGVFQNQESLHFVLDQLTDKEKLKKSRVHPVQVLAAWLTYKTGVSVRGDGRWDVNREIVAALETGFYFSFGNVKPMDGNVHVGLDVSGSMANTTMCNIPGLTPRVASAALSMIQWRTEKNIQINTFSDNFKRLDLKKYNETTRFEQFLQSISNMPFQRTDCSLPMQVAAKHEWPVDTFIIYTDNETWSGNEKPMDALRRYRQQMGIAAKLVVVGMTATEFTIADPNDAGSLDVVGFDLSAPALISDFARVSPEPEA